MRFILAAMAAVTMMVGVAVSQPADARCFWNGFAMECFHRPHFYGWGYHHRYWDDGFDRPYWRGGY